MAVIGNSSTQQAFTPAVDYFSGNGSTTAFTLSRPVASVAQVEAVIDNVVQNPSSAYTVSSNTITFTSAPLSGTNNIYVRYTSPITQVIAPGQGTVTATSMASSTGTGAAVFATSPTITTPTLSGDTTAGTINGLTVGKGGGSVSTNTAVGASALNSNTTAAQVTAFGYQAAYSQTNPDGNSAFGYQAMYSNATGANSVAIGRRAAYTATDLDNTVAVGAYSLTSNTTGDNNTAIGKDSLYSNTTASNNTAVGYQAGYSITTGEPNVFIGKGAGYTTTASTTATNCIYIGADSRGSANNNNAEIVLGCATSGKGSNTAFISPGGGAAYQGNNSSSWSTTSDRRLKKNIVDNTEGLDKITQIRVRNFEYRTAEEVTELPTHSIVDKQGIQLGVIAQELQQVCPDCVKEESTGVLSVDSDNVFWHMVNAIKELKALVDAQATEIAELKAKVGV